MAWNYQPYQQNQVFVQQPQAQQNSHMPDRLEQMRQQQYQLTQQPMQEQMMGQPAVNNPMQFYPMGQMSALQSGVVKVLSEAEAQSYLVAPGAKVVMMDARLPKMYIKSVDMNNDPHFEKYRLVREYDEPITPPPGEDLGARFVPRDEFDRLREEHEKMLAAIAKIAEKMEGYNVESDS